MTGFEENCGRSLIGLAQWHHGRQMVLENASVWEQTHQEPITMKG
jgi:hypothetical protein